LFWFTLAGASSIVLCIGLDILVLIVLWQEHPLLYCALVWAYLFWLYFGRGILLFDINFFAHTKESFFLHLRGSQLFAAELLRSQWSAYHSRNFHFIWNLKVICRVKTNLSLSLILHDFVFKVISCLAVVRISFV
jgi:hypothetical protein